MLGEHLGSFQVVLVTGLLAQGHVVLLTPPNNVGRKFYRLFYRLFYLAL